MISDTSIPKVIHFCWFGGKPLSSLAEKCIESWKRYFPDYQIIEWNEANFDVESCDYIKEAYQAKKWAFVSDYARFKILYDNGGVYFDTDVEILKTFDDIIKQGPYMGCEYIIQGDKAKKEKGLEKICVVNPGLGIATYPGNSLYKEMIDDYHRSHFLNENGTYNYRTVVDRMTDILKRHGYISSERIQKIENVSIYPPTFFCPMDYSSGNIHITEKTRSIHWYDASWQDEHMRIRRRRSAMLMKFFKGRLGIKISNVYMSCSYYWEWISTGQFTLIKEKIVDRYKHKK